MNVEVLVSTMNKTDKEQLVKEMNIKGNVVVINQVTKKDIDHLVNNVEGNQKMFSFREKGLSKSRNKAIDNSNGDICVIADDDLKYVENYEEIIKTAYEEYKDADIIAFYVESEDFNNKKMPLSPGKVGYLKSMKIQSVQMTFKRKSIQDSGLKFDENFGAGTDNYMGEENIFLFDALNKGLKIVSVPVCIATIPPSTSTWFEGYDLKYFRVKSKMFRRMSKKMWLLLVLQFVIRKRNLYKDKLSFMAVLKEMLLESNKEETNLYDN